MVNHLAIPFQYDATGSASVVEQDTIGEVAQCVRVLLSTPTGTRIEQFDYGIPDPTFTSEAAIVAQISAAVARFEPRAIGLQLTVATNGDGSTAIVAKIPEEHR
jgi:phage baseplate assembly protein W